MKYAFHWQTQGPNAHYALVGHNGQDWHPGAIPIHCRIVGNAAATTPCILEESEPSVGSIPGQLGLHYVWLCPAYSWDTSLQISGFLDPKLIWQACKWSITKWSEQIL